MAFREIPKLHQDKDAGRMVKHYKHTYSLVVKELLRLLETDAPQKIANEQASLARQIQLILKEADEQIEPEIKDIIEKSHKKGQAQAILSLGDAKTLYEATQGVEMTMLSKRSAEAMIQDTFEDVLAITDRTNNRIKKTVRDIAGETMRLNAVQQMGYDTNRKEITEKLLKEGFSKKVKKNFKGVTDSAGRKWKIDGYINMLVKTKMQQAYIEGVRSESIERGTDLGLISSHGATDACRHYEGMVISMTGDTKGFYSYDELMESNQIFHPNCQHTVTPLRDLDLLPQQLRDKHEQKMDNLKIT